MELEDSPSHRSFTLSDLRVEAPTQRVREESGKPASRHSSFGMFRSLFGLGGLVFAILFAFIGLVAPGESEAAVLSGSGPEGAVVEASCKAEGLVERLDVDGHTANFREILGSEQFRHEDRHRQSQHESVALESERNDEEDPQPDASAAARVSGSAWAPSTFRSALPWGTVVHTSHVLVSTGLARGPPAR